MPEEIHLADIVAWQAFVELNRDGILSENDSLETALEQALHGGLEMNDGQSLVIVFVGSGDAL